MGYKRVLEGEARQCVQLVKVGAAAEINLEFAQQRERRQTRERAENFSSLLNGRLHKFSLDPTDTHTYIDRADTSTHPPAGCA